MVALTLTELWTFYDFERKLFTKLVNNLLRNPIESLLSLGLWLWLEDRCHNNVVTRLLGLEDYVLGMVADEAVLCIRCLESDLLIDPYYYSIPLTAQVLQQDISLRILHENKYTAISGVKRFLRKVCSLAFTDILCQALPTPSNLVPYQCLKLPGFPSSTFGDVEIRVWPLNYVFMVDLWSSSSLDHISIEDRSLYITFSQGFPVQEQEMRMFFTSRFGDCIDLVDMGNMIVDNKPLFAQMVLCSVEAVDQILRGNTIAKYRINGKHAWVRKYQRKVKKVSKKS